MKIVPFVLLVWLFLVGCTLVHPLDGFASGEGISEPEANPTTGESGHEHGPASGPSDNDGGAPLAARPDAAGASPSDLRPAEKSSTGTASHFVYCLGGSFPDETYQDNVYFAQIFEDGTLGEWDVTTPMRTGIRNHIAVVHGDEIFVIGGEYMGGLLSGDVHVASIQPNGRLGRWKLLLRDALVYGRKDHSVVLLGNDLYVSGGFDGRRETDLFLRGDLTTGNIQEFAEVGSLLSPLRAHAMVAIQGAGPTGPKSRLVTIGGAHDSGRGLEYTNQVASYEVTEGRLGGGTVLPSLPVPTAFHRALELSGSVYVLGGLSAEPRGATPHVFRSPVASNGALGAWATVEPFRGARWGHGVAVYKNYLLVSGGRDGTSGALLDDVQVGVLRPNGELSWRRSGISLPSGVAFHALVVH